MNFNTFKVINYLLFTFFITNIIYIDKLIEKIDVYIYAYTCVYVYFPFIYNRQHATHIWYRYNLIHTWGCVVVVVVVIVVVVVESIYLDTSLIIIIIMCIEQYISHIQITNTIIFAR